jgi:hypothetical protein
MLIVSFNHHSGGERERERERERRWTMSAVHNRSGSGDCYIHLGPHNVTEVKDCEFFPVRFDNQPLKNRSSSI